MADLEPLVAAKNLCEVGAMEDAPPPPDIRRFETLQVVSILIGLLHSFVLADGDLFITIGSSVLVLGLTLLVSRRRKNWARWVILIMWVLGALMLVSMGSAIFERGYLLVTCAVIVLQAVALAFLFTARSAAWLSGRRSAPPSPAPGSAQL